MLLFPQASFSKQLSFFFVLAYELMSKRLVADTATDGEHFYGNNNLAWGGSSLARRLQPRGHSRSAVEGSPGILVDLADQLYAFPLPHFTPPPIAANKSGRFHVRPSSPCRTPSSGPLREHDTQRGIKHPVAAPLQGQLLSGAVGHGSLSGSVATTLPT